MSRVWQRLRDWFFPIDCIGCGAAGVALCLPCGPRASEVSTFAVAGVPVRAVGTYDGTLRRAIVAMKRGERAYLADFSAHLAELVPEHLPLVPLPTTRRRRAVRGFDQSCELARRAAEHRRVPYVELLAKIGAAQRGRSRAARLTARGRFRVVATERPRQVVVLDDVCTTGATLADAIDTLRDAGIEVVAAVVLARTPIDRNHPRPA